jgi:hypothetical protein
MNMKTFGVIYCLLILSGFLAIVAVGEYHVTVEEKYRFVDLYQTKNESIADYTTLTFVEDVYLYKTDYVDAWSQTVTLVHGTDSIAVLRAAFDMGCTIIVHNGTYYLGTGTSWELNSSIIIDGDSTFVGGAGL